MLNHVSCCSCLVVTLMLSLRQIGPARFRAPELLFRPDLIGDESEGIHEVLAFAIQKSDMDLRRTLFSNIVLSGGSTLLKGAQGGPTHMSISLLSVSAVLLSVFTFDFSHDLLCCFLQDLVTGC